jgi:hypothetical protein
MLTLTEMLTLEVPLTNPRYLSPGLAVGEDPSGQLVCFIRTPGDPTKRILELLKRVVTLCELEFLEDPFFYNERWCCKLKERQDG